MHRQSGFTLVEVMVVAGMVAGLSLAIMQMTQNANKTVKKISQDTEILSVHSEVMAALKDKDKCQGTLGGFARGPVSPPAITGTGTAINRIYNRVIYNPPASKTVDNAATQAQTSSYVISSVAGQEINARGTQGAFIVKKIEIFKTTTADQAPYSYQPPAPAALTQRHAGEAMVRVSYLKGTDTSVTSASAKAIQDTLSFGTRVITRDIKLQVVLDTTDNIVECYADENSYVEAACVALGGSIDTMDGRCN